MIRPSPFMFWIRSGRDNYINMLIRNFPKNIMLEIVAKKVLGKLYTNFILLNFSPIFLKLLDQCAPTHVLFDITVAPSSFLSFWIEKKAFALLLGYAQLIHLILNYRKIGKHLFKFWTKELHWKDFSVSLFRTWKKSCNIIITEDWIKIARPPMKWVNFFFNPDTIWNAPKMFLYNSSHILELISRWLPRIWNFKIT